MNKMNYLTSTSRKVEIVSLLAVTGEVTCVIVTSNGFVRRTTASECTIVTLVNICTQTQFTRQYLHTDTIHAECTIVTLVNICTQTQFTPSVPLSHSSISAHRHNSRRVYHCHTRQYLHTDTVHAPHYYTHTCTHARTNIFSHSGLKSSFLNIGKIVLKVDKSG